MRGGRGGEGAGSSMYWSQTMFMRAQMTRWHCMIGRFASVKAKGSGASAPSSRLWGRNGGAGA